MDNIIDSTYFWGEIEIAGLNIVNTTIQGIASNKIAQELDRFIAKYQSEYLKKMFGEDVADALTEGDALTALLFNDTTKTSPIANYVYFYYQKANATVTTVAGEKNMTRSGMRSVSPAVKMVDAWNEMVTMNYDIQKYLYDNETIDSWTYEDDILPNISTTDQIFSYRNIYGI